MIAKVGEKQQNKDMPLSMKLMEVIEQASYNSKNERLMPLFAKKFTAVSDSWLDIQTEAVETLQHFIYKYCEYLPQVLSEFIELCNRHNWQSLMNQVSDLIMAYFDQSFKKAADIRLFDIIDKVYFSHRIIEEIHDHMMCQLGKPLVSWNMTNSNLLMHQIIESDYASKLDQTVIELSHKLLAHASELKPDGTIKNQAIAWPCFCENLGIRLAF